METHLGGDHIPGNRSNPEEVADLKRHLDNLTRRHKIEIETIRNEAIFNANQEYELKLKQWQVCRGLCDVIIAYYRVKCTATVNQRAFYVLYITIILFIVFGRFEQLTVL